VSPRTGRRTGVSGTRASILEAARLAFAERGYDGATIRVIASGAKVDPALIHHYFGTKERLFVEAVGFPEVPSEMLAPAVAADSDDLGEAIVRTVLGVWERPESRAQGLALLRAAVTNDEAASMLRGFVSRAILGTVATVARKPDAELRAALVGAQIVGLGIARFVVRIEPLASADPEVVVAAIGPTVQRYLTGDLGPPRRRRRPRSTGAAR
jgi:AcrR family transcriptional regulator